MVVMALLCSRLGCLTCLFLPVHTFFELLKVMLQDHKVAFKPKPGQLGENASGSVASISQAMGGLAMPCHFWNTKVTAVVWMVRWTVNGLSPIRPVVVWLADPVLDGCRALKLEAAA